MTITALLNLNCKRVRTHSPTTLLSSLMSSPSSSSLLKTAVVPPANGTTNPQQQKHYLCLFQLITAGSAEENLGSDEQEIIEMAYLIIDAETKQVSDAAQITQR